MDHIVSCPSCRNLIRKTFLLPPPPQPLGPTPLRNRLFVFCVFESTAFDANLETSSQLVLDATQRRHWGCTCS